MWQGGVWNQKRERVGVRVKGKGQEKRSSGDLVRA